MVFFSYSRDDSEFVLKLAKELRQANADVWLDQIDIPAGEHWDSALQNALTKADTLLVVLSKTSISSDNVMDEVSYALEKDKKVVPVLLEDCDIPLRIHRLQFVDLTKNYEQGIKSILRAINTENQPASANKQKERGGNGAISSTSDAVDQDKDQINKPGGQKTGSKSKTFLITAVIVVIIGAVIAYFNFSISTAEEPNIISDSNQEASESYFEETLPSSTKPLTHNVIAVDYKLGDKNPAGTFVQIDDTEWEENSNLNNNVYYFEELSRDDKSIYLKDSRYYIELDLEHERIILTSVAEPDSGKLYYSIVGLELME